MPQMFPMEWTLIFTYTLILMILMLNIIHYTKLEKKIMAQINMQIPKNSMSWKW